jgi:hypothetical protein
MKGSDEIMAMIQNEVDRLGRIPTVDELNKIAARVVGQANRMPIADAEGLSPDQLQGLLYSLFEDQSPVKLNQSIADDKASSSPLVLLCIALLQEIENAGHLKLTATGALPLKLVIYLYEKKFLTEDDIERGRVKIRTEKHAETVHLAHILCELAGLVKLRKGKISMTAKGKSLTKNPAALLIELFKTFFLKFNWAYFDGYESEHAAQFGAGFTLFLLHKYGRELRKSDFYASLFIKAFPMVLNEFKNRPYSSPESGFTNCYVLRTFQRGLYWFGLVEVTSIPIPATLRKRSEVTATPLFYDFVLVK